MFDIYRNNASSWYYSLFAIYGLYTIRYIRSIRSRAFSAINRNRCVIPNNVYCLVNNRNPLVKKK